MTAGWRAPAVVAPLGVLAAALAARIGLLGSPQLDYDEGVYWESLRSLAHGHILYREVYSSQPPAFLLLLEPGFLAGGQSIWPARAVVAVLSMALVAGAWLALRRRFGPGAALAAAGLAAFDPLLLRGSVTLQADVPSIGLAVLSFGLGVEAIHRRGRWAILLAVAAGVLAAVAVMTKLLAAPLAVGLLVLFAARRDLRALAAGGAGALAAAAACLVPVAGELEQVWQQSVLLHLNGRWSHAPSVASPWTVTPAGELVLAPLAAAGLVLAWRQGQRVMAVAAGAWLAAALLFLALQRPAYPHHVVAASGPAVLPAAIALERLGRTLHARAGMAALVLAAMAGGLAAVVFSLPAGSGVDPARLAAAVPRGRPIVTDDQFLAAAAGLDTPPGLVDTSSLRVNSGDLTTSAVEQAALRSGAGAVVLGTGRLARLDGFIAWVAVEFPDREDLGDGRVVNRRAGPG